MAGVKAERSSAGHKKAPQRPKDWVAPAKVVTFKHSGPVPTAPITAPVAETDEEKAAVVAYNAACKALAQCKPNDKGAEKQRSVAYQRLVQLGLAPQVRGRIR